MNLIAIDPGAITGWAVFSTTTFEFLAVGLLQGYEDTLPKNIDWLIHIYQPTFARIEFPKIYDRKNWKGDPNHLLEVAYCAGKCAGQFEKYHVAVRRILPNQWKGQRPKAVDHAHTRRILTPKELRLITELEKKNPASKSHNALDAVGIGLHAINRR